MNAPHIGVISLGCPKALVDTENILSRLRAEGYELSAEYASADLVLINTCGFIDEAIEESFDAIEEAFKENGRVVVTGCLGKKADKLLHHFPNLLGVTGPHDVQGVLDIIHQHLSKPHDARFDLIPPQGIRLTPSHYAYLKISEGCSHRCRFCVIPQLRGPLVSRPLHEIMREAETLVEAGVQEILVVSQDTAAFGMDRKISTEFWDGRPIKNKITDLADALGNLGVWIRLHYLYPYANLDALVELMAEEKILPYLDMPLQHASPTVLRAMRRPAAAENVLRRIEKWRNICPDLTIRSTFITGFPGESDADFDLLLNFLEEAQLDRVGCFSYSAVEGAEANDLPDRVPLEVADERRQRLMAHQEKISEKKLKRLIGQQTLIMIDEIDGDTAIGRRMADAPDIDGLVYVANGAAFTPGDLVEVVISRTDHHDCYVDKPVHWD